MARITGIALAVAACLALAACGGASSSSTTRTAPPGRTDAARVVDVAKRYTAALVQGDYRTACALLTPTARARFADDARATGGTSCAALLESVLGAAPSDAGAAPAVAAKVVSLANGRAKVRTTVEGQAETLALDRDGTRWGVDASL